MQAFDSISHKSLWSALEQCGIKPQYVNLLKRVCAEQRATVLTDEESDVFEIKRGTKEVTHYPVYSSTQLSKWRALKDDLASRQRIVKLRLRTRQTGSEL